MNRNLTGGYYIVSLYDVELLGESVSLPDVAKLLYYAKKYKFVVFQDIMIGGNYKVATPAMFEADKTLSTKPEDWDDETDGEFVPEELYTAKIYNLYGKNIEIDADGVASVTDYEVQADTETLYGKFVRVINASDIDINALTDEQIELFKEGVFINGDIGSAHNPIMGPARQYSETLITGYCLYVRNTGFLPTGTYTVYQIDTINKTLTITTNAGFSQTGTTINSLDSRFNTMHFTVTANDINFNAYTKLNGRVELRGKVFPDYPADQPNKTYVLKLISGTLTWVEETA